MFKKISLLILGVMVVGFCITTIPAGRVDAATIICSGTHKHNREGGTASCRGDMWGSTDSKEFMTSKPWWWPWGRPRYRVVLSELHNGDWYTVWVKGDCRASNSKSNIYVVYMKRITINY